MMRDECLCRIIDAFFLILYCVNVIVYIKFTEIRIIFAVLFFLSEAIYHLDTQMVKNRQRVQFNLSHHQEKWPSHICPHTEGKRRWITAWGADRLKLRRGHTRPFLAFYSDSLQPSDALRTIRLRPARRWAQRKKADWWPRTTPRCRWRMQSSLFRGYGMVRRILMQLFQRFLLKEKRWDFRATATIKDIFHLYYSSCPSPC